MIQGRLCECKERVIGRICDTCIPGYWNLNRNNPLGCAGVYSPIYKFLYTIHCVLLQGSHMLKNYLKMEIFPEKSLKIYTFLFTFHCVLLHCSHRLENYMKMEFFPERNLKMKIKICLEKFCTTVRPRKVLEF